MNTALHDSNEVFQDRYGLKLASYLSLSAAELPHEFSERLRAARVQAVASRKVVRSRTASAVLGNGSEATLAWGSENGLGWWGRIGAVLPLLVLVVGLLTISFVQEDSRAQEIAEVDAALLTDALPPAAFADSGFLQFLKITR